MNGGGGAALYTPAILGLAVDLAQFPLNDSFPLTGSANSRVCGSRVELGIGLDDGGLIQEIGTRVSACAIGQASAALFVKSALGRNVATIAIAADELEAWLAGCDETPDWPGISELTPTRSFPARHAAILLPWKAALAALSNPARPD